MGRSNSPVTHHIFVITFIRFLLFAPSFRTRKYRYEHDTDKTLTQIRFVATNNQPIGVLNWYSVHPTSMNNKNKLLSSDNVGYASILLEKELDSSSLIGHGRVVAAFSSTNLGDSSPNTRGAYCTRTGRKCDMLTSACPKSDGVCMGRGPGIDDRDSCRIIGTRLFEGAIKLLRTGAGIEVTGDVNYIHQFIDMPHANTTYRNSTTKEEKIVGHLDLFRNEFHREFRVELNVFEIFTGDRLLTSDGI